MFPLLSCVSVQEIWHWLIGKKLKSSCGSVISFVTCRVVGWTNSAAMSKSTKKQETLDKHVVRPFEIIAGTYCVCLLRLAFCDQKRSFSSRRRYQRCDDLHLLWCDRPWLDHLRWSFQAWTEKIQGAVHTVAQAGPNAGLSGEALLSIPECLYRHKKLLVYFGNGLIEKGMLSHKSLYVSGEKISDRKLLRKKAVMSCTCKKMMALVKSKVHPIKILRILQPPFMNPRNT